MQALFSLFAPGWKTPGLAAALSASLTVFSPATLATDVLVITDSQHPVNTLGGERLIELDAASRITAELSADLPADPAQATAIVSHRLSQGGNDLQRRIASAYRDMTDAWSLGITTLPAVVVDQRYVIYGEPDVANAIARIAAYRRSQP